MKKQEKSNIELLKRFIVGWNNTFPYDKLFRNKYKIPFNSSKHRELSQIDIYTEILEDKMMEKHYSDQENKRALLDSYKETGEFLLDKDHDWSEEDKDDAFDKLMASVKQMNDK